MLKKILVLRYIKFSINCPVPKKLKISTENGRGFKSTFVLLFDEIWSPEIYLFFSNVEHAIKSGDERYIKFALTFHFDIYQHFFMFEILLSKRSGNFVKVYFLFWKSDQYFRNIVSWKLQGIRWYHNFHRLEFLVRLRNLLPDFQIPKKKCRKILKSEKKILVCFSFKKYF